MRLAQVVHSWILVPLLLIEKDIVGERAQNQSGQRVALNGVDSYVAIDAWYSDDGGGWINLDTCAYTTSEILEQKVGQDLQGGDSFGYSADMNRADTRLVAGALKEDTYNTEPGALHV